MSEVAIVEIKPVEAARHLGISLDYLYRQLWTGKITARKADGEWKVSMDSVLAQIFEQWSATSVETANFAVNDRSRIRQRIGD